MAFQRPAAPLRDQLTYPKTGKVTGVTWPIWLRDLRADVDAAPSIAPAPVVLEGQSASIGTTAIPTDGDLSAGHYRVTVYQRITTADSVSSSLQTTLTWTDGSVTCTFSGTALTGNTTATVGSFTFTMHIDSASPISYSTTVVLGSGNGRYRLGIFLERLDVDA